MALEAKGRWQRVKCQAGCGGTCVIRAWGSLRQEDKEFKGSSSYMASLRATRTMQGTVTKHRKRKSSPGTCFILVTSPKLELCVHRKLFKVFTKGWEGVKLFQSLGFQTDAVGSTLALNQARPTRSPRATGLLGQCKALHTHGWQIQGSSESLHQAECRHSIPPSIHPRHWGKRTKLGFNAPQPPQLHIVFY